MSVIGLPVNLGVVADVADKKACGGRFGMRGVEVAVTRTTTEEYPRGKGAMGPPKPVERADYRVSATDSKVAVVVEGECGGTDDVPGLAGVRTAPNTAAKATVPAAEFKKVFGDAAKHTKRARHNHACKQVVASLGTAVATFGYTDTESERVQQTTLVAEKFPPLAEIIRDTAKTDPVVKFAVDPNYLAQLAKLAAGFCDPESMRLEIEVRGENKPILLTATSPTQKLTMLLMPLSG